MAEAIEYVTTSIIDASPEAVWRILVDADGYAAWNPEIVTVTGAFGPDARITARVHAGSALRSVRLRVTKFDPPSSMEWTGGLPFGLFVGRRMLTVTPWAGGTHFRMHLHMSGPLARMVLKPVGDRQPEIDRFSAALKAHAERQ